MKYIHIQKVDFKNKRQRIHLAVILAIGCLSICGAIALQPSFIRTQVHMKTAVTPTAGFNIRSALVFENDLESHREFYLQIGSRLLTVRVERKDLW